MTQEALKMALSLLEDCVNSYGMKYERPAFVKAIIAVKEALAQPAQAKQCNYPDCKCPTENPCLKGLNLLEQDSLWTQG